MNLLVVKYLDSACHPSPDFQRLYLVGHFICWSHPLQVAEQMTFSLASSLYSLKQKKLILIFSPITELFNSYLFHVFLWLGYFFICDRSFFVCSKNVSRRSNTVSWASNEWRCDCIAFELVVYLGSHFISVFRMLLIR